MLLVPKAGDGDVDPWPPVGQGPCFGELQRPARIGVLLRGLRGLIGPNVGRDLARLDRLLLGRGVALTWDNTRQGVIFDAA